MYRPYRRPVTKASPDVKVAEPKMSKFIIFLVNILSRPYIFFLFGFAKIVLKDDKILFDAFKRALSDKSRYIIAFRHPDGREPQILAYFFLFKLTRLAAKNKVYFAKKAHAIFVYGYEVVRWGGPFARFFMPNIGAVPIHHTKLDSKGMARIYKVLTDGPYPLTLAPEGQVSYNADSLPRLEVGTIRIGLQAAEQLRKKEETEGKKENIPVEILPLSFHLRYDRGGQRAMEKLLKKIEKCCGLKNSTAANPALKNLDSSGDISFRKRLERSRNFILEKNENRYNINIDDSLSYEQRLEQVVNAALETCERILNIKGEGEFFPRLYRVRHLCWDRIFLPESSAKLKKFSQIERGILDLRAGEAWHIARHQELADFAWYFRCPPPEENDALHKKVEYVQNLWDFANRTMGGTIANRVNILPDKVILKTAPSINISERLSDYKADKKSTINSLLSELEKAYLDCIEDVSRDTK